MTTHVSTKGQVVIPKAIRERLGLKTGLPLEIRLWRGAVILRATHTPKAPALKGKLLGTDLLKELEKEHARES